ncbi:hypothetical protein VCHA53P481_350035 [Vibrio chagasii]|nr:hypothetical protein VCHA27O13_80063 [Vibrio chagasii]CAH6912592.1 hypothetical protein VCHA32O87_350034 [Vibrio chagasii]CAH6952988.1 hypothetical protein VCHA52P456_110170 [Vibrio chagasii]CAH7071312.1 hypothetical protein VCHA54P499_10219 [Vibrio chagasii]CAH7103180.1 hypothetical protein VCHA53O466_10383 [Vibrio chagasii]
MYQTNVSELAARVLVPQGEPNSRKKLNRKIELFHFNCD